MAAAIVFLWLVLSSVVQHLRAEDTLVILPVLDVTFFGAMGDGETDDTQAFLTAWEAACLATSSTIYFPPMYSFVIGAVTLSGPCAGYITLQVDGTIMAKDDLSEWSPDLKGWLVFNGLQSFRLTGYGVIDGRGDSWWALSCKLYPGEGCRDQSPTVCHFFLKLEHNNWQSVVITRSSNIEVSYLTLKDSQEFHLSIENCADVYMSGLQISAPSDSPNTDGIHIARSENVYLQNSLIGTGDDCISIQTGSYNINIQGVTCGPGHGISIGGLGKDDSWACVAGVYIKDVVINGAKNGLRIKTWQGGLGAVHDVNFESVTMNDVANPIIIDQFYCDSVRPCENQTYAVEVHDIRFKNIEGTSRTNAAVYLACSDTFPCQNIILENVSLFLSNSGDPSNSFCWNAWGEWYGEDEPHSCLDNVQSQASGELQSCLSAL